MNQLQTQMKAIDRVNKKVPKDTWAELLARIQYDIQPGCDECGDCHSYRETVNPDKIIAWCEIQEHNGNPRDCHRLWDDTCRAGAIAEELFHEAEG